MSDWWPSSPPFGPLGDQTGLLVDPQAPEYPEVPVLVQMMPAGRTVRKQTILLE